jgi:hypothetical protein
MADKVGHDDLPLSPPESGTLDEKIGSNPEDRDSLMVPSGSQPDSSLAYLAPEQDIETQPSGASPLERMQSNACDRSAEELLQILEALQPSRSAAIAPPDGTSSDIEECEDDRLEPAPASVEPTSNNSMSTTASVVADFMSSDVDDVFRWEDYIGLKGTEGQSGAKFASGRGDTRAGMRSQQRHGPVGPEKAGKNA